MDEKRDIRYDVSVLIATFNRAQDLSRTLEGMARTDKGNLAVRFVVVDNGSTDETKAVVESFYDRLLIQYISERRSGKNCALNAALGKGDLGKIIVFTDDDVDVPPDWLISIFSVCERWPHHAVFGGRINVVYPNGKVPKWASDPFLSALGFARHNISEKECIYDELATPYGPNMWMRREIFDSDRRFDEALGPRPTNRLMGSERSFLTTLLRNGFQIVYSPLVVVGHRVQPEMMKLSTVFRRAYRLGRSEAHIFELPSLALLRHNRTTWRLQRVRSVAFYTVKVFKVLVFSDRERLPGRVAEYIRHIGHHIEAMRLATQVLTEIQKGS